MKASLGKPLEWAKPRAIVAFVFYKSPKWVGPLSDAGVPSWIVAVELIQSIPCIKELITWLKVSHKKMTFYVS